MLTELILDKLGFFYDDIAKKKHGTCPEITYGELISTIIKDDNSNSAHTLFPMGQQTFNRMMRNVFPNILLNGGNETWFYFLLSLIEHRKCTSCKQIKPYIDFCKDSSRTCGINHRCKICVNTAQIGHQHTYAESFKKSQEKNKDKIYARNAKYRTERKFRCPKWAELDKIEAFYAACPEGYHVDHVLPLKGEFVSGLHVLSNLQYLPNKENLSKGNRINLALYNKEMYGT